MDNVRTAQLGHHSITREGGGAEFLNSINYVGLFHFPSAIALPYLFHTLPQAEYLFRFLKKNSTYKVDFVPILIIDKDFMAAFFNFAW